MTLKGRTVRSAQCFDALILSLLDEREMHGYEIFLRTKSMKLFNGANDNKRSVVYAHLRKMENEGFIVSEWSMKEKEKPKRVYSITEKGKIQLSELMSEITSYAVALFELVERYRFRILS